MAASVAPSGAKAMEPAPPDWRARQNGLGMELEHHVRGGAVRAVVWALGVGSLLFFGYWLAMLLWVLIADPQSLEWGALFGFVLFGGGFAFGLYCIARLFARTRYVITAELLVAEEYMPGYRKRVEVPRALVRDLTCVRTPTPRARAEDNYSLVMRWQAPEGQRDWLGFAGSSRQEAQWLGALLSTWSGKPVLQERSGA